MPTDTTPRGVYAAVLTPLTAALEPDAAAFVGQCRWLLEQGCDGLAPLGTTGEANSLSVAQRRRLIDAAAEAGIPGERMIPGTGSCALADAVELSRAALAAGAGGVLLLPPFYYKNPSDDGLFAYFAEVIGRIGGDIKLYLYHFPQQAVIGFGVSLIARLLDAFPGVVKGIKDSSGDFANSRAYAEHFAARGFEVYAGDDSLLRPLLQAGGAGCITAAANVNCAIGAEVYAHCNEATGEQAQRVLTATRRAVTSVALIPGLKSLVARNTGDPRWTNIRPPHLKLSAEQESALFAAFDASGVRLAKAA
jgi:4-hydroxy-tetrahydrodipicolinate synthase